MRLLKRAPAFAATQPDEVFGLPPFSGEPTSLEDVEAVEAGVPPAGAIYFSLGS